MPRQAVEGSPVVVASPTVATLQEVDMVEASSHLSCLTACTLRVEASIRVLLMGLKTILGGTLEGAHGLAPSESAKDP